MGDPDEELTKGDDDCEEADVTERGTYKESGDKISMRKIVKRREANIRLEKEVGKRKKT